MICFTYQIVHYLERRGPYNPSTITRSLCYNWMPTDAHKENKYSSQKNHILTFLTNFTNSPSHKYVNIFRFLFIIFPFPTFINQKQLTPNPYPTYINHSQSVNTFIFGKNILTGIRSPVAEAGPSARWGEGGRCRCC